MKHDSFILPKYKISSFLLKPLDKFLIYAIIKKIKYRNPTGGGIKKGTPADLLGWRPTSPEVYVHGTHTHQPGNPAPTLMVLYQTIFGFARGFYRLLNLVSLHFYNENRRIVFVLQHIPPVFVYL